ncbi:UDP-glucuronic acid decarboxylase 1-like [Asparagus officinalis]|uniref:UDP-glucuronic acid decarboxylase 1-like n=1 Tax=Asparagus officinalis TaxID=4686 RepID=UPI00098E27B5|nr:UDP-glucuronic acid decarboxylase 1-like [Asparagus officinalis]
MVRGRDACWEHCVLVDATKQKVGCNYYHRKSSGRVYKMKFHLAQIKNKDIVPCTEVPNDVSIARIFNTYGPRMCIDDGRVVSNFVAQALRRQPMTVYGGGKQTRSFQYVSDLVAGLMALMKGDHVGPFNLGNPGEFTMLELAEVVKETIDPTATIEFKPNTADDEE